MTKLCGSLGGWLNYIFGSGNLYGKRNDYLHMNKDYNVNHHRHWCDFVRLLDSLWDYVLSIVGSFGGILCFATGISFYRISFIELKNESIHLSAIIYFKWMLFCEKISHIERGW